MNSGTMTLPELVPDLVVNSDLKVKKKKKKKKNKKIDDIPRDEKSKDNVEIVLKTADKKKKKKKKKKDAVNSEAKDNNINIVDAGSKATKEKKNKKKKSKDKLSKKRKAVEAVEEPNTSEKKKKKKKKKNKDDASTKSKSKKDTDNSTTDIAETAVVSSLSKEAIEQFHKENRITIHLNKNKSSDMYAPLPTFEDAKRRFPQKSLSAFQACCGTFKKPSPIQAQAWPIVLQGKDLVGVAATGSGKTLAFVLPGISKLINGELGPRSTSSNGCAPRCLVLSPTRELAIQSAKVAEEACAVLKGFSALVVFGGNPKREQINQLRTLGKDLDFLVATPGRLLDFVEGGEISLDFVKYMVLDEADRMLDMGFEKDVKRIISQTNSERQTVMFSATWPEEIRAVANTYMDDPIRIVVGSDKLAASKSVKQHVEVMEPFAKERRLRNLLDEIHDGKNKIIIFGLYKKECARLETTLLRMGYKVSGIHGDKNQSTREEAVRTFEQGRTPLLVATDVASRGLDIDGVEYVINYTFPLTVEDYVHRIGRTGRAGNTGTAYTFFTSHEKHLAGGLQNILRQAGEEIPEDLAKFGNTVKKKEHKMYGAHFKQFDGPMKKASRITFD